MITFEQARLIAVAEIAKALPKYDFVLLDEETVTRPYGWVFFYNTRRYLETGHIMDTVPGNAPFVVNKFDGSVHYLSTSGDFNVFLARYEQEKGY